MAIRRNFLTRLCTIASAIWASSFASLVIAQTNAPIPVTHEVEVQLVQTTTTDGSEVATVFGDASQREVIENQVNNIWSQCGIKVNFRSNIATYANDFAFDGRATDYSVNTRPQSHLAMILADGNSAGVASTASDVVASYFTRISPGFSLLPSNTAAGLARVDGNGMTLAMGSALLTFPAGRGVVAFVFAHELGHNLGLNHEAAGSPNLLSTTGATSQQLTQSQCSTVFSNNFGLDGFDLLQPVTFASCDFDGDGQCDLTDLDYIYENFGSSNALLNLDNSDGLNTVNELDISAWLVEASLPTNPYKADPADTYIPGDVDLDGDVNSMDLGTLLVYFDKPNGQGWERGDFNGDAVVDPVDLGVLLNKFNFQSSSAVAVVPEPGSIGLCLVGLLFTILSIRQKRRTR